jgi:hypothetical protein
MYKYLITHLCYRWRVVICEGIENIRTKRNILAKLFNGPNFKEPIWGRTNGPSVRVRRSEFQGQPLFTNVQWYVSSFFTHTTLFNITQHTAHNTSHKSQHNKKNNWLNIRKNTIEHKESALLNTTKHSEHREKSHFETLNHAVSSSMQRNETQHSTQSPFLSFFFLYNQWWIRNNSTFGMT